MKIFFKKLWSLSKLALMIWLLCYIFKLAAYNEWGKLAKTLFFVGFGVVVSYLELVEYIFTEFKRIIKYNDFD